jgi:acetyl-CoA carboxylase biotin carboxyl carrier protein
MTLSADDIKALIAEFRESDWEEMQLTAGDVSVVISRTGGSSWIGNQQPPPPSGGGAPSVPPSIGGAAPGQAATATAAAAAPPPPAKAGPPPAPTGATSAPSGHAVTSPTVGLFWRSPQPGTPPFVDVGQRVGADDTVCVIEVMKLMNQVKAGVAGTVASIEPENGAMVEHGTVLITIDPDA